MTDTPLSAAEVTLWNEAKHLAQMMRDTPHWETAQRIVRAGLGREG